MTYKTVDEPLVEYWIGHYVCCFGCLVILTSVANILSPFSITSYIETSRSAKKNNICFLFYKYEERIVKKSGKHLELI